MTRDVYLPDTHALFWYLAQLPQWAEIPEMHDRLIAIAASRLNAVMLSKDAVLQACPRVKCVW